MISFLSIFIFLYPMSPITPSHRVLSKSNTIHFLSLPKKILF